MKRPSLKSLLVGFGFIGATLCTVACDDESDDTGLVDAMGSTSGGGDGSPVATSDGASAVGVTDASPDAGAIDAQSSGGDAGGDAGGIVVAQGRGDPGCADNTREGLVDRNKFPGVAACAGIWIGDVGNAQALCAPGWYVCQGNDEDLGSILYADATGFDGCFAVDSAQDNYVCASDCSAQIGVLDTAESIDMGAIGNGCPWKFQNARGCFADGRIDGSENSGTGCNYYAGLSGVACCVAPTASIKQ